MIDTSLLKILILEAAESCYAKGPAWAQERVVLNEIAQRLPDAKKDRKLQEQILTCWHDFFRQGELSWGHDFDNPNAPWFHVAKRG